MSDTKRIDPSTVNTVSNNYQAGMSDVKEAAAVNADLFEALDRLVAIVTYTAAENCPLRADHPAVSHAREVIAQVKS